MKHTFRLNILYRSKLLLFASALSTSLIILICLFRKSSKIEFHRFKAVGNLDRLATFVNNDHFETIAVSDSRAQIYSAYVDARPDVVAKYHYSIPDNRVLLGLVRVLAALPVQMAGADLVCHYVFSVGGKEFRHTSASSAVEILPEDHRLPYAASFILCPLTVLRNETIYLPDRISVAKDIIKPKEFIDIHYREEWLRSNRISPPAGLQPRGRISVCVKPIYLGYNNSLQVVEFIEMYTLLGADHFFFYKMSISNEVDSVLNYYVAKGLATVLRWDMIGMRFREDIWSGGMLIALNDCLYRSAFYNNYSHVINADLDEYLLPQEKQTLSEFIDERENSYVSPAVLVFKNAYHYLDWVEEESLAAEYPNKYPLLTQCLLWRHEYPLEPYSRSKYIVRASEAIKLGNHQVWELTSASTVEILNENVALSHHYRYCLSYENCDSEPSIIDDRARNWGRELYERVEKECSRIFPTGICPFESRRY